MSLTAPALSATVSSPLDLIGKTPMVEVTKIDTGPCRLLLKLESQNPGGSIKDRIAISMLDAAEREGFLKEGGTIVEATAGNTGLALTLVTVGVGACAGVQGHGASCDHALHGTGLGHRRGVHGRRLARGTTAPAGRQQRSRAQAGEPVQPGHAAPSPPRDFLCALHVALPPAAGK